MRYRVDYVTGDCSFAGNRQELIEELSRMEPGMISDVRRLYKSGVSDLVTEKYLRFVGVKL